MQNVDIKLETQVLDSDLKFVVQLKSPTDTKVVDNEWKQQAAAQLAKKYSVPQENVEIAMFFKPKKIPSDLTLVDWSKSGGQYTLMATIKGLIAGQTKASEQKVTKLQNEACALRSKMVESGQLFSKSEIRSILESIRSFIPQTTKPEATLIDILESFSAWFKDMITRFHLPDVIIKELEIVTNSITSRVSSLKNISDANRPEKSDTVQSKKQLAKIVTDVATLVDSLRKALDESDELETAKEV